MALIVWRDVYVSLEGSCDFISVSASATWRLTSLTVDWTEVGLSINVSWKTFQIFVWKIPKDIPDDFVAAEVPEIVALGFVVGAIVVGFMVVDEE